MKIEQLKQLIETVKSGSLNQASKNLYLSRSSLSTSIKNLEEELGAPILIRHSKGVSLTPFGANVYNQAKEICDRINFLQYTSKKTDNQLFIANMFCSMANDAVAEMLKNSEEKNITLYIEEAPLRSVFQKVCSGLCEIGVVTIFSGGQEIVHRKMEEEKLEFHPMAVRQLGALVGPKNPMYRGKKKIVDMKDLHGYPHLINYATPTDHTWEHNFTPQSPFRDNYFVSDLGLALRLVENTNAVMIDSQDKNIYENLYGPHDYRFIPIKDYPPCTTGWIKLRHNSLSTLAKTFISLLSNRTRYAK